LWLIDVWRSSKLCRGQISLALPQVAFELVGDPEKGEQELVAQPALAKAVGSARLGMQDREATEVVELLLEDRRSPTAQRPAQAPMQLRRFAGENVRPALAGRSANSGPRPRPGRC
jgi:hypothetical protein